MMNLMEKELQLYVSAFQNSELYSNAASIWGWLLLS